MLTPPQRDFEDESNDDILRETIIDGYGLLKSLPNIDTLDDMDEGTYIYATSGCNGTWILN